MNYGLISTITKSIIAYMSDLYTSNGYTMGREEDDLSIVLDWRGFDFTLPSIAIGYIDDTGYKEADLGSELIRSLKFELNMFARKTLEREGLADIFVEDTTLNSVNIYDYNQATPVVVATARIYNQVNSPNRVETPEGEQKDMVTLVFDVDYRKKIN